MFLCLWNCAEDRLLPGWKDVNYELISLEIFLTICQNLVELVTNWLSVSSFWQSICVEKFLACQGSRRTRTTVLTMLTKSVMRTDLTSSLMVSGWLLSDLTAVYQHYSGSCTPLRDFTNVNISSFRMAFLAWKMHLGFLPGPKQITNLD